MKIQSNQHSLLPELWLNRTPTAKDKNKRSPQTSRKGHLKPIGKAEAQNSLVSQPHVAVENQEGYLDANPPLPPEE